ncbi:hypothetical protein O181_057661 [Austropuccinia psidii MF-1]|uniref:Uncharacterized protein n=1 Tax=Austropuccinia psidii MF-1 TaxID=1389203 RepID=A0A9Q3HU49_9BASI|nr:hypothetical protein [Austropuccinia psidii MF-1]
MPSTPPSHRPNPQHHLPSLRSCSTLKMRLGCCPPYPPSPLLMLLHPHLIFSTADNPYASFHLPNPIRCLPFLHSCIRFIGYSGLLAYMMNTITEIY